MVMKLRPESDQADVQAFVQQLILIGIVIDDKMFPNRALKISMYLILGGLHRIFFTKLLYS